MALSRDCDFNDRYGFHVKTNESAKLIKFIENLLTPEIAKSIRLFNLRYAHGDEDATRGISELSSGEFLILNLLSRIFNIYHIQPKHNPNSPIPELILLDEAETSFHPEWQRRFIGTLVKFFNCLVTSGLILDPENENKSFNFPKFQIIYTTHSPITLSDMPQCCINYLQRETRSQQHKNDGDNNHSETFGANVFDLYRDSFFMKNGLVGSFATSKIKKIVKDLNNDNYDYTEITKRISIIGDIRVKEYLSKLLETKRLLNSETELKNRIKELTEEIERLKSDKQ